MIKTISRMVLFAITFAQPLAQSSQSTPAADQLDLRHCIQLALENNNRAKISRDSVDMALAVHR